MYIKTNLGKNSAFQLLLNMINNLEYFNKYLEFLRANVSIFQEFGTKRL